MDVLYITGRETDYTRNYVLLRAFQRLGHVTVCAENTPGSIVARSLRLSLRAWRYLRWAKFDIIFVGFYGHLLMLPVGLVTRRPGLFDAFVSTYDTLCFDRRLFPPCSVPGRLAFWLDQRSCRLARRVLVDTPLQVDYFVQTFGLPCGRVSWLPVGCNEEIFAPQPPPPRTGITRVLYYSSYQPLHGVEIVIGAAALLGSESIHFKLIGTGQEYAQARRLAEQLALQNVSFVPFVPLKDLAAEIASADICLGGPFGPSGKASRVIPGKIYQILAMARPLVAADTPANRELLVDGESAYLCVPHSAEALAKAVLKLHQDVALAGRLALAGRELYLNQCSESIITERLQHLLVEMNE
jgi:glycosyltransferase involved in cell wall biosynthesis